MRYPDFCTRRGMLFRHNLFTSLKWLVYKAVGNTPLCSALFTQHATRKEAVKRAQDQTLKTGAIHFVVDADYVFDLIDQRPRV